MLIAIIAISIIKDKVFREIFQDYKCDIIYCKMDQKVKKQKRLIKLILAEILMVISAVLLVIFLVLIVRGYRFGRDWNVVQAGLVQINSVPSEAEIWINGNRVGAQTRADRMLAEGQQKISLKKEGYDSWEKLVRVLPGKVVKLRQPRLFLRQREKRVLMDDIGGLEFFGMARDRETGLMIRKGFSKVEMLSFKGDNMEVRNLEFGKLLEGLGEEVKVADFEWSNDSRRLLLYLEGKDKQRKWILLNLREPEASMDLGKEFGLELEKVVIGSDNANILWALEQGNLREINVSGSSISKVLDTKVERFDNRMERVVYVQRKEKGVELKSYKSGDKEGALIGELKTQPGEVKINLSEYFGERYLSVINGKEITIYKGEYGERGLGEMEVVLAQAFDQELEKVESGLNERFLMIRQGERVMSYDLEEKSFSGFNLSGPLRWLDDYILYKIEAGELKISDFDGSNQRVLTKGVALGAMIGRDDRWLYYLSEGDKKQIVAEKIHN